MAIGSVEDTGQWFYVHDKSGKETVAMQRNSFFEVKLLGFCDDFFLIKDKNSYFTYNQVGKQLGTLILDSSYQFDKIQKNNMIFISDNKIYSYDKSGKMIASRQNN